MSAFGITRSTEATGAEAVARAARERTSMPNGFWGMAVFVATETTLFGVLIGTYFYLRFHIGVWPPQHIAKPEWIPAIVVTGVLAAMSGPMQLAYRAGREGRRVVAWRWLAFAFLVQAGYLGYQLHAYVAELHLHNPSDSAYSSIYYTLLGADHLHVLVGLLFDVWMLIRLATGLTNYRLVGLMTTTFYWHVVNAVTIFVLLTQLSPYV